MKKMPVPDFFKNSVLADEEAFSRGCVRTIKYDEIFDKARVWAQEHSIPPACTDVIKLCLMPIDMQNTFCSPAGELFVAGRSGRGAIDDCIRTARWIYEHAHIITSIVPTMDMHTPFQIFFRSFFVDRNGNPPAPNALVLTSKMLRDGDWVVNPNMSSALADEKYVDLQRHAIHYCEMLEQGKPALSEPPRYTRKYPLTVWGFHAQITGAGHALVPFLEEAIFFHTIVRWANMSPEVKGGNPLTENYSVLRPEVLDTFNGMRIANRNTTLLNKLLGFDMIVAPGEAKSHCHAWTIDDLITESKERGLPMAKKIYLPEDATSPVVIPNVGLDFTDQANAAFDRFEKEGVHLVRLQDPIDEWPSSPYVGS